MFRLLRRNLFRFCFFNKHFSNLKIEGLLNKFEDYKYEDKKSSNISKEIDLLSDFSEITKMMEQIYNKNITIKDESVLQLMTKIENLPSKIDLSAFKTLIIFMSFIIKKNAKLDFSSFLKIIPKIDEFSKTMTLPPSIEAERLYIKSILQKYGKELYFDYFRANFNKMDEKSVLRFLMNIRKLNMATPDKNFAKLISQDQDFLTNLFSKIKLDNKDANAISNLIISFSQFNLENKALWTEILQRSCLLLPSMSEESLSLILGNASNNFKINCATLNSFSNEFFSRLKNGVDLKPRYFAEFLRNLVNRNIQKNTFELTPNLLAELKKYIIKKIELFEIKEIITLIHFYAVINCEDKEFVKLLEEKIYSYKGQINVGLIAIFMYDICILNMYSQNFLNFVASNLSKFPFHKLNRNDFAMVMISLLSIDIEVTDSSLKKSPQFNEYLNKYLHDYHNVSLKYLSKNIPISTHHTMDSIFDFVTYAKAFGLEVISEPIFYCYNVDFVIKNYRKTQVNIEKAIEKLEKNEAEIKASLINISNTQKERSQIDFSPKDDLIVEIDGPRHYIKNRIKGGTLLKRRLTEKLGYKLVVLSSKDCLKIAKIVDKRTKLTTFLNIILGPK